MAEFGSEFGSMFGAAKAVPAHIARMAKAYTARMGAPRGSGGTAHQAAQNGWGYVLPANRAQPFDATGGAPITSQGDVPEQQTTTGRTAPSDPNLMNPLVMEKNPQTGQWERKLSLNQMASGQGSKPLTSEVLQYALMASGGDHVKAAQMLSSNGFAPPGMAPQAGTVDENLALKQEARDDAAAKLEMAQNQQSFEQDRQTKQLDIAQRQEQLKQTQSENDPKEKAASELLKYRVDSKQKQIDAINKTMSDGTVMPGTEEYNKLQQQQQGLQAGLESDLTRRHTDRDNWMNGLPPQQPAPQQGPQPTALPHGMAPQQPPPQQPQGPIPAIVAQLQAMNAAKQPTTQPVGQ